MPAYKYSTAWRSHRSILRIPIRGPTPFILIIPHGHQDISAHATLLRKAGMILAQLEDDAGVELENIIDEKGKMLV